jgi:hypothetical protein
MKMHQEALSYWHKNKSIIMSIADSLKDYS